MTNEHIQTLIQLKIGDKVRGSYYGGLYSGVVVGFTFSDKDDTVSAIIVVDAAFVGSHGICREAGEGLMIRTNDTRQRYTIERAEAVQA